jgi:hypothetical protein
MRVESTPTNPVSELVVRNEQVNLRTLRATVATYVLPVFIGLAALPTAQAHNGYQSEDLSYSECALIVSFTLFCAVLALGGIGEDDGE